MSILRGKFQFIAFIFAFIAFSAAVCAAQDIEIVVRIAPDSTTATIDGALTNKNSLIPVKNWSFANSAARVENLGARISDFRLFDKEKRVIAVKKFADGEYLAQETADAFHYQVSLDSSANPAAAAHASSFSGEQGILMLGDLLPQISSDNQIVSAQIKFDLPKDWKIISGEKRIGENTFEVENIEKGIFAVGKNWRELKIPADKKSLNLTITGDWQISDEDARHAASEIYAEYQMLFGDAASGNAQIYLIRLPKNVKFGRWEAETRGANLTVASADMPFKTQSLQLLHEQFRHELFHLWLPNDLALTGNYDWFYEGFTIYQALKTGIKMNRIRFEDFLDTLAQAYNLDSFQETKISLIESSKNRWSAANNPLYARGMLVAFLCDVALLKEKKKNHSLAEIFRKIYQTHRFPNSPEDGNQAILKILRNYSELDSIIENYIVGANKINWKIDLESVGIELLEANSIVNLRVKPKPNGRQKDFLDKLGYNNWRKISEK